MNARHSAGPAAHIRISKLEEKNRDDHGRHANREMGSFSFADRSARTILDRADIPRGGNLNVESGSPSLSF
jgi:hypothetical protein